MTQLDLSEHLGVGLNTVKGWESGRTSPSPRHLKRLKAMNLPDVMTIIESDALAFVREVRRLTLLNYAISSTFCDATVWLAVMVK